MAKTIGSVRKHNSMCFGVLAGCGQKLSSDFNKEEVTSAAENVITLVNEKDSEGLRKISALDDITTVSAA